jgi:hypothetical protein
MNKKCLKCGKEGKDFFGFVFCDSCKSKLRLFTDLKIKKYISENPDFEDEINRRLDFLEIDYSIKKVKLLHIKEKIKVLRKIHK